MEYLYQPEFAKRGPRAMSAFDLACAWDVTKPKKKRRSSVRSGGEHKDRD